MKPQLLVRLLLVALACSAAGWTAAAAQGPVAAVEVRIWQDIENERNIYVSARPQGGNWGTLGTISLPLDDGRSKDEQHRYGDIALTVPLEDRSAIVEVRVWQNVNLPSQVYLSARPAFGSWAVLGTIRLHLDDGRSSTGRYRYGDIALDVPVPEGSVTTLAGGGAPGYQDGGAAEALFGSFAPVVAGVWPQQGIAFERDGSLLVTDKGNDAIRRISPAGRVSTLAGGNGHGLLDGPAETAQFSAPVALAIAEDGTIYVVEQAHRLRKVTPEGMVSTVAGFDGRTPSGSAFDGPVEEATFSNPAAVAVHGNAIYVVDSHGLRRIAEGEVSTLLPRSGRHVDGPVPAATVGRVVAMDAGSDGALYLLDYTAVVDQGAVYAIRVVQDRQVRTLYVSDLPAFGGAFSNPSGIAAGPGGTVYVSSTGHHQVLALMPDGKLRVVAGTGEAGHGDGRVGEATLNLPTSLALHRDGTMAVVDAGSDLIRLIDSPAGSPELSVVRGINTPYLEGVGEVKVFAGRGAERSGTRSIVDGPAWTASFGWPKGMALDTNGSVLLADRDTIRSIAPDGYVTTLAGSSKGYLDGPCNEALFTAPENLALSPDGDIYVAEINGHRIRRISRTLDSCEVATVIGSDDESEGLVQEGAVPVEQARVRFPRDIAFDRDGNLLILHSNRIRLLTTEGVVYTYTSRLGRGTDIAFDIDDDGNIFVLNPSAIVMLDGDGVLSPVFEIDLPFLWGVLLDHPFDIVVGPDGALYATDSFFDVVLRFTRDGEAAVVAGSRQPRWNKEERPLPEGAPDEVKFGWTNHLLFDANGDLLLSDPMAGVIWRIPLPDGDASPDAPLRAERHAVAPPDVRGESIRFELTPTEVGWVMHVETDHDIPGLGIEVRLSLPYRRCEPGTECRPTGTTAWPDEDVKAGVRQEVKRAFDKHFLSSEVTGSIKTFHARTLTNWTCERQGESWRFDCAEERSRRLPSLSDADNPHLWVYLENQEGPLVARVTAGDQGIRFPYLQARLSGEFGGLDLVEFCGDLRDPLRAQGSQNLMECPGSNGWNELDGHPQHTDVVSVSGLSTGLSLLRCDWHQTSTSDASVWACESWSW